MNRRYVHWHIFFQIIRLTGRASTVFPHHGLLLQIDYDPFYDLPEGYGTGYHIVIQMVPLAKIAQEFSPTTVEIDFLLLYN